MNEKELPKSYRFNPAFLDSYTLGMDIPKFDYGEGGRVIIIDKFHPLARFLAYYFRLVGISRRENLIWNAYRESSARELVGQGIVSDEDENLRTSVEGSIALLRAYRDEVAKTGDYAVQKGWPKNKWPMDCLQDLVKKLDEELKRIQVPIKPSILELV